MTEETTQQPGRQLGEPIGPPPLPALPLEYSTLVAREKSSRRARFLFGFFGYILFSILWFAGGNVLTHFDGGQIFAGWAVTTVLLLALALFLRLRYRYSGFGYGILSALLAAFLILAGLIVLLIALCSGKFG
jgi:hypothetical protein